MSIITELETARTNWLSSTSREPARYILNTVKYQEFLDYHEAQTNSLAGSQTKTYSDGTTVMLSAISGPDLGQENPAISNPNLSGVPVYSGGSPSENIVCE